MTNQQPGDPRAVGVQLAHARMQQGRTVAEMAQQLKLLPRQVEALDPPARKRLAKIGVTIGTLDLFAPALLKPEAVTENLWKIGRWPATTLREALQKA